MAWINLVSDRCKITNSLERRIGEWEKEPLNGPGTIEPLISALLSGDQQYIEKSFQLSIRWFDYLLSIKPKVGVHSYSLLSNYVNYILFISLFEDMGELKRSLLEEIAYARTAGSKEIEALKSTITQLLIRSYKQKNEKRHNGFPIREDEFYRKAENMPPAQIFNICSSLDHPYWLTCFIRLLLPSALMLEASSDEKKYFVKDFLAFGAYPSEHIGKLVYERKTKKPDINTLYNPEIEETWWGFDAVEITENGVNAYNWLGFNWEATLLFVKGTSANAFRMYDSIKENWELVRQNTKPETYKKMHDQIQKHGCKYKFVYNSRLAIPVIDHLKRAQDFYGIDIELIDIMDI